MWFFFFCPFQAAIRKELNDYKSTEMEVHESSRHLTRYRSKGGLACTGGVVAYFKTCVCMVECKSLHTHTQMFLALGKKKEVQFVYKLS